MQWVRQIIAEGREVIDIGPDFLRRASTGRASSVYEMERRLLKGYPNYVRDFQRWHRLQGGNPYVGSLGTLPKNSRSAVIIGGYGIPPLRTSARETVCKEKTLSGYFWSSTRHS